MCVFLDRLVEQGVQTHQTSENWRLNDKLKNNERTGIKADYQYKKEALVLQYIAKNGKALFTIGFNIHDKRPEFFTETPKVRKTTSRSTPAPSSTPDSTPDSPTPTPTSDSDSPKTGYNKDPNLAPKENTEPNDDPGPGPDTNNGVGAIFSTEDQPENSNHYTSYEEYREDMEELAEINQNQKTGEDDNTPTVVVVDSENIDNNADEGTGYGGINSAMPIQDSATTNGHPVTSDIDGVPLDGPPD